MDTSKEYVKMCYEARELQDRDFVYFMTHPKEYVGTYECEHGSIMTWLPRQDQLQEIMRQPYSTQAKQLRELATFDDENTFRTYEQLWLAFVMKEKYNKIWNGEEWKNEKR